MEANIGLITVTCDRCGASIDGMRGEFATAGFYDTIGDSWWSRYAKPGENVVCDNCMWADPQYQAEYGAPIRSEMIEVDDIVREVHGDQG